MIMCSVLISDLCLPKAELNTKNSIKQQLCCRLVEFFVFNSVHQLISVPSDEVYRVSDGGPDHAVPQNSVFFFQKKNKFWCANSYTSVRKKKHSTVFYFLQDTGVRSRIPAKVVKFSHITSKVVHRRYHRKQYKTVNWR